jgi:hypothetical protein
LIDADNAGLKLGCSPEKIRYKGLSCFWGSGLLLVVFKMIVFRIASIFAARKQPSADEQGVALLRLIGPSSSLKPGRENRKRAMSLGVLTAQ